MSDNTIPKTYDPLVQLLEDAADGAHTYGVAIGLKQNDETALRAALTALVGTPAGPGNVPPAVPGLKDNWNMAKTAKVTGTAIARSAMSNGRAQATACMGVLKPLLGKQWNNAWQVAGFTNHSLAVPDNPLPLLQQFRSYFAANPTQEVTNAALNITATAAACEASAQAISDGISTSNQSNTDSGIAKQNLQSGMDSGRSRLSGLRGELTQLIDPDDDRWYAFGFDKPSDPSTPAVPQHVTVTPGSAGMVFVDFDDARRADNYRVTVNDTATPQNQLAEQIVTESECTFMALPSGTAIKVIVTGRNSSGGESGPSDPASGTVP
jgi:hypothetical protein